MCIMLSLVSCENNWRNKMKEYTKAIIKEIGKDAKSGIARAGKAIASGLAHVVCKASYPILGNFSRNVQERLENFAGKGNYNSVEAMRSTYLSNFLLYVPGSAFLASYLSNDTEKAIVGSMIGGVTLFVAERFLRENSAPVFGPLFNPNARATASALGKVASLPLDLATYAYDAASDKTKDYLEDIKRRARNRIQESVR